MTTKGYPLPTKPEVRAKLEAEGFRLLINTKPGSVAETWWDPNDPFTAITINDDGELMGRGRFTRQAQAASILGLYQTTPPGMRLVAEADVEHIQNLADEAAGGRQYDQSWIQPRTLSMQERADRMKEVALQLAALSGDN